MRGYINPNYGGWGDYRNDLAVIFISNRSQLHLRNAFGSYQEFQVATQVATQDPTPDNMPAVRMFGWGRNNPANDDDPQRWAKRQTGFQAPFFIESATPYVQNGFAIGQYFSVIASSTLGRGCRNDSGGGWFDDGDYLKGVVSWNDGPAGDCNPVGFQQMASRTDWAIFDFIPTAMQVLQVGEKAPCRCERTFGDPQAPGSHAVCNVGCEDPQNWNRPMDQ